MVLNIVNGNFGLVSYWSHSEPHTGAQLERSKRLAQLDNQICGEKDTEFYELEMVCMLVRDFYIQIGRASCRERV